MHGWLGRQLIVAADALDKTINMLPAAIANIMIDTKYVLDITLVSDMVYKDIVSKSEIIISG
jgi:hypothetical protein